VTVIVSYGRRLVVDPVTWADAAHSGVIVFVRAPDDPNAPPIDKPSCP
jgi:hypothetical protein